MVTRNPRRYLPIVRFHRASRKRKYRTGTKLMATVTATVRNVTGSELPSVLPGTSMKFGKRATRNMFATVNGSVSS